MTWVKRTHIQKVSASRVGQNVVIREPAGIDVASRLAPPVETLECLFTGYARVRVKVSRYPKHVVRG